MGAGVHPFCAAYQIFIPFLFEIFFFFFFVAEEKVWNPRCWMSGKPQVHVLHEQRRQIETFAVPVQSDASIQYGHAAQVGRTA